MYAPFTSAVWCSQQLHFVLFDLNTALSGMSGEAIVAVEKAMAFFLTIMNCV